MEAVSAFAPVIQDTDPDDLIGKVTVLRKSDNPQKKNFGDTYLGGFHYRDAQGNLIPRGFVNGRGEPQRAFFLGDGGKIVLDKQRDAYNIESLKLMKNAEPPVFPAGFTLDIIDHGDLAKKAVGKRHRRIDALLRVNEHKDDPAFIISVARRLGGGAELNELNKTQVLDYVQGKADSDPELVLDILDDSQQGEKFTLDAAKGYGIITLRNGVYYFRNELLGKLEDEILLELRKKPDAMVEIQRLVRTRAVDAGMPAPKQRIDVSDLGAEPDVPGGAAKAMTGAAMTGGSGAASDSEFEKVGDQPDILAVGTFMDTCKATQVPDGSGGTVPLVAFRPGLGFYWNDVRLGAGKAESVTFLFNNPAIREQLSRIIADAKSN